MSFHSSALYASLYQDLSYYLVNGNPPDITVKQFAANALWESCFKKFIETEHPKAAERCLDKFLKVNKQCSNWALDLKDSWSEVLFGELKQSLYNFWYREGASLVTHPYQILDKAKMGPGASRGVQGYDFYTKLYSSSFTSTSDILYEWYKEYIASSYNSWSAEDIRSQWFGTRQIVPGNKLEFVPKTVDIKRLICVEPSLNMYYQLGFGDHLLERLKEVYNIDLADQPDFNRILCHRGSLHDSYATIDLSSASDSISIKMLKEVLPKPFFDWLKILRSPSMLIDDEYIELEMISTMGNGYTFPLQTVLFSCVVAACYRARGIPLQRNKRAKGRVSPGNFGVFGDDIIVLPEISSDVISLLSILGFETNVEKTFTHGPFRESCGFDYFRGHMVRGVYIKRLDTQESRFSAFNQLALWSSRCQIPLTRSLGYLLSTVSRQYVPLCENPDAGLRVPQSLLPKKHYAKGLFGSVKYKRSVPRPLSIAIQGERLIVPRKHKPRLYNPFGLLTCALGGFVNSGQPAAIGEPVNCQSIGLRIDTLIYNTKIGIAPSWDYIEAPSYGVEDLTRTLWPVFAGHRHCEWGSLGRNRI